jgi:hypothetical protein
MTATPVTTVGNIFLRSFAGLYESTVSALLAIDATRLAG